MMQYIEDGTYILEETKAPAGYQESGIRWEIVIKDIQIVSVSKITESGVKEEVPPVPLQTTQSASRGVFVQMAYQYENQVELYELPSTGGPGIHLYMLGGTLLMMAGALLVYKKRKEEVLRS